MWMQCSRKEVKVSDGLSLSIGPEGNDCVLVRLADAGAAGRCEGVLPRILQFLEAKLTYQPAVLKSP